MWNWLGGVLMGKTLASNTTTISVAPSLAETWVDLEEDYLAFALDEPEPVMTRVRIGFNDTLTWAERETFRKSVTALRGYVAHEWEKVEVNKKPKYVTLVFTHDTDSRKLVSDVARIAETKFLNLHPVSVKTIDPDTYV